MPGLGRAGLRVAPRCEVHDAVGERDEAVVVGGDDDESAAVGQATEQADDAVDLQVVEVGGGLVGEQDGWVVGQRPGDRHPLLLAAGQVARLVLDAVGQPDLVEQLQGACPGRPRSDAGASQRHLHVLGRAEAREEIERLEDDADLSTPVLGERAPLSPTTSVSPIVTEPEDGVRIPARTESSVVLPQPLAPSSSTSSPPFVSSWKWSIGRTM